MPRPRPGFVPRPRLAERLDEGLARGLVLVCASAGYGKTTLLAEWVRRGRQPVTWLSLDAGDNDPATFWRHTVAALDQVRPGISERMGPLLGPPPPPSFEPLVTALINEVAGQPDADEALLLHATAAAHARTGSLIEIGALRALDLAASGEEAAAVAALAEALILACPQGYVRVFADEGPPMAALLAPAGAGHQSARPYATQPPGP